jgi:hypothetical protein
VGSAIWTFNKTLTTAFSATDAAIILTTIASGLIIALAELIINISS